jgi:hypothetical protein
MVLPKSVPASGSWRGDLENLAAEIGLEQLLVAIRDGDRQAEVLGVVGHHQEVERSAQARLQSGGRGHRLALGEAVGVVGRDLRTDETGIGRVRRVQMGVAEQDLVRKVLPGQGRVARRCRRWDKGSAITGARLVLSERQSREAAERGYDGNGQGGSDRVHRSLLKKQMCAGSGSSNRHPR